MEIQIDIIGVVLTGKTSTAVKLAEILRKHDFSVTINDLDIQTKEDEEQILARLGQNHKFLPANVEINT